MNKLIATILTLAFGITLGAQEHGDILITGGTVITITGDILEDTDVLIRNGKINQIGEGSVSYTHLTLPTIYSV